jgi:hypothetical protein
MGRASRSQSLDTKEGALVRRRDLCCLRTSDWGSPATRKVGIMEREPRTRQTQLKLELRQIEVEIRTLRREQQFYRRLGFDHELKEVQILDLQLHQRDTERQLALLDQRAGRRSGSRLTWAHRFLVAPYVVAYGFQWLLGGLTRVLSDPA